MIDYLSWSGVGEAKETRENNPKGRTPSTRAFVETTRLKEKPRTPPPILSYQLAYDL